MQILVFWICRRAKLLGMPLKKSKLIILSAKQCTLCYGFVHGIEKRSTWALIIPKLTRHMRNLQKGFSELWDSESSGGPGQNHFEHDGALPYFSILVRPHLYGNSPNCEMRRADLIAWRLPAHQTWRPVITHGDTRAKPYTLSLPTPFCC